MTKPKADKDSKNFKDVDSNDFIDAISGKNKKVLAEIEKAVNDANPKSGEFFELRIMGRDKSNAKQDRDIANK